MLILKPGSCLKILLLSYIIITLSPIVLFASQDEPDGFRGIKIGTNITEVPDMVFKGSDGDVKIYIRKDDEMKFGDANLERIRYLVKKDKFYSVKLYFSGSENYTGLKKTCEQLFGSGSQPPKQSEEVKKFFWRGKFVNISLLYFNRWKKGVLRYGPSESTKDYYFK